MTVRHGFIDESIRSDGWYRLTMVDIAARDVGVITRELRSMIPQGRQRVHFSAEGHAQRRRILDAMLGLPFAAVTLSAPYRRGQNEEPARRRCIQAMLTSADPAIVLLVFDSRGPHRDRNDRRVLSQSLLRGGGSESLSYSHRGSKDEPLLALPDAIGWSLGAGGYFTARVRGRVRQIVVDED